MSAPDSEAGTGLKEFAAARDAGGSRLDQWLAGALGEGFSRSRVQALIRGGAVRVGGRTVIDPGRRLAGGEPIAVELPPPEPATPMGEAIALDILFEDDELIVVNKPAGLVVHPAAGNWTGTLVNALIHHCGDSLSGIGGVRRPGIVHRLDKDTSGVMVVAKTDRAHRALAAAFADHGRSGDLERVYRALVWGVPGRSTGTVAAALGRAADRVRRAVVPGERADARPAVTHYQVEQRFGDAAAALLSCRLETGRTHQIRVHMAYIGHPLVGDADYGRGFRSKADRLPSPLREAVLGFGRQALHAGHLAFRHPTSHIKLAFDAPMPADMLMLVESFRAL